VGRTEEEEAGDRDSYVITEDDYIDYLALSDISKLVPKVVMARLKRKHFLFLGYSLSDWNLRIILHRIWGELVLSFKSWAVQSKVLPSEEQIWIKRNVEIFKQDLVEYLDGLKAAIQALPPPEAHHEPSRPSGLSL
jgi:hypothetical protein